jgi:hypothetical protein
MRQPPRGVPWVSAQDKPRWAGKARAFWWPRPHSATAATGANAVHLGALFVLWCVLNCSLQRQITRESDMTIRDNIGFRGICLQLIIIILLSFGILKN